jgi:hypothetical protein
MTLNDKLITAFNEYHKSSDLYQSNSKLFEVSYINKSALEKGTVRDVLH